MIAYEAQYYSWLKEQGVGLKDQVSSSPKSYVSYLNGVSKLLKQDITPLVLSTEDDVLAISSQIRGLKADGTIGNYRSAMRQYVEMVRELGLSPSEPQAINHQATSTKKPVQKYSTATADSLLSSYRESLLEHIFSAEVMRHLWLRGNVRIETLKPQVDDGGYDLVLEANGIVRHVQLKASHLGSTTRQVTANMYLMNKPSGCVIWLWFNKNSLELGPFGWFGSAPGSPLPNISQFPIAKHTKANLKGTKSERPNLRVIKRKQFDVISSINELVFKLFGKFKER